MGAIVPLCKADRMDGSRGILQGLSWRWLIKYVAEAEERLGGSINEAMNIEYRFETGNGCQRGVATGGWISRALQD